jgi:antitoxin component YwqK of YwqJK toxin-antitoxin module
MKNIRLIYSLLFITGLLITSCTSSPEPKKEENRSDLVVIKNGVYTEFYPGKKAIKFRGPQNTEGHRNGRWYYYSQTGDEQSSTEYTDGKKNGFTFVRYPNGAMRYTGEYTNDIASGLWRFYKQDGTIEFEKNYATEVE